MTAGQLTDRVALQAPQEATNDQGGLVETWLTYAEPWAATRPPTGGERTVAGGADARLSQVFEIRYDERVRSTHRILHNGRIYVLTEPPRETVRRTWMTLYTMEFEGLTT